MDEHELFREEFWQRLADHERPQFYEYVQMLASEPEAICHAFNPSRRHEFVRLLTTALGIEPPD